MKRVHREAINKRRPPSCRMFRARNHGTIPFLKLGNPIIQIIKKHLFPKIKYNSKILTQIKHIKLRRQVPRRGGGVDAGAHESPPKINLETNIRGGNKWSPKNNWNKKQMLSNTIPQGLKTYKEGRGRKRPRPSLCVLTMLMYCITQHLFLVSINFWG